MEKYSVNELRKMFLDFFETKKHLVMPSFSLVPQDDKSLLLINAGMAPLKPYFTGAKTPPSKRVATCQKCIRTIDIENVGKTSRHGTFFEMLGNFSFGDYFKEEIIPWSWEFITEVLGIPKDRLYVTIYENDDEAKEIWEDLTDIDPSRIFKLGKKDNFWEIGTGPCGPCSEIHYDYGNAGEIKSSEEFEEKSDADLLVEFWNLVFTQFDKDEEGNYNPLPAPNIDTGMGLERLAVIMQGKENMFEIDSTRDILKKAEELTGTPYGQDREKDISLRIITDHVKSAVMLISDGVLPSNEGRGYVLRRLLRRAARHGRVLGRKELFLREMVKPVVDNYSAAYMELIEKQEYIEKIVNLEEEKFNQTLDQGMHLIREYIDETEGSVFSGDHAFRLYDTYGFPLEVTEEILSEKGLTLDYDKFRENMKIQKETARAARGETGYTGQDMNVFNTLSSYIDFTFTGYEEMRGDGNLLVIADEEGVRETLEAGSEGYMILDSSPFYAEMGGQVGDKGMISGESFKAEVLDTKKNFSGETVNIVRITEGTAVRGPVTSVLEDERRMDIRRNHTATHLLHKALKEILGNHVNQAGSLVDEEKLRFDFNHFSPVTKEELGKIENLVNTYIMRAEDVKTDIMSLDEAREAGAMALFDAKYGEKVRVVSAGTSSMELCGGTHVSNTGQIGPFRITSESGIASGIRRIEAVTGWNTISLMDSERETLRETSGILKTSAAHLKEKAESLQHELKEKDKEISGFKKSQAMGSVEEVLDNVKEVFGMKVVTGVFENLSIEELRDITEKALDRIKSGISLMASKEEGRVNFCIMVSKDLAGKKAHAGKLIGQVATVAGGKGGGRPDMAQAGGKEPEKAQEAVDSIYNLLQG